MIDGLIEKKSKREVDISISGGQGLGCGTPAIFLRVNK